MTRLNTAPRLPLIIDADTLLYAAACVNMKRHDFADEDVGVCVSIDEDSARQQVETQIDRLLELSERASPVVALTDTTNFRKTLLPSYKSNRKHVVRPEPLLSSLREWAIRKYSAVVLPSLEADDVCGILMSHPAWASERPALFSVDKDLNQIPGLHYDADMGELYEVSRDDGDLFFYMQVLTGDSGDGYGGCPGIGIKKAARALAKTPMGLPRWEVVTKLYEDRGKTYADAVVMARMAFLLRHDNYNIDTKEITSLWLPPQHS